MKNAGLVLEGGGMRGLYTSGVLDFFMEKGLYFPYVIGVSAGACNALSYISRQPGRSHDININYANDPRYINYTNLLKGKGLFNMEFAFNDIPDHLIPFDYRAFEEASERLVIPATDCNTGKAVYFEKDKCKSIYTAAKASSSLPFVSKMVSLEGYQLLDGGIADPIPIVKSLKDGNTFNVVVLTRHKGYRKSPSVLQKLAKTTYMKNKELAEAICNRYKVYNDTLDYIEKLERENKVLVFRPRKSVEIDRVERDVEKLKNLYWEGYHDAKREFDHLEGPRASC
ncbi:patatin-like phospholipase family protein [Isachenkonia alkalipeptolytica]|uniref:Patatin family protein n=1 Tax=Isachenkonia alkalipeptolytica TaxID=2565777 RepID=A0AA43XKY4_9CLOT|nr:patatin family protein [Isachenkonia alkalipeptolytica]NBG88174.1 patatin family protein [Isachenkonia alkalipeptolytica]